MSDTILAAIIGAVAALVAALIGAYLPRSASGQRSSALSQSRKEVRENPKVGTLGCSVWLAWLSLNLLGALVAGGLAYGTMHAYGLPRYSEEKFMAIAADLMAEFPDASEEELVEIAMARTGVSLYFAVGTGLSYFLLGIIQWLFVRRFARRSVYWLLGAFCASLLVGFVSYRMDPDALSFVVGCGLLPIVLAGPILISEMEAR